MNINRLNYEEFFLLYVDNELNIAQRKAVESFIEQNPDLKAELVMLLDTVLPADDHITFGNKGSLLKTAAGPNPVNETNCEEYFVLYADDELSHEEKDKVEQFVYRNPQHQVNFEVMQKAKLMPDMAVTFPDKYSLYRKEEEDKAAPVIRIRFWRIAAAAAVLFFVGGMGWYLSNDGKKASVTGDQVATNDSNASKQQPAHAQEGLASNDQTNQPKAGDNTTGDTTNRALAKNNTTVPVTNQDAQMNAVKNITTNEVAAAKNKFEKNNTAPSNISIQPHVTPLNNNDLVVTNDKKILDANTTKGVARPNDVTDPNHVTEGIAFTKGQGTIDATKTPLVNTGSRKVNTEDISKLNSMTAFTAVTENDDDESIYPSSTTNNKKNKMRGFFRKVSRVFEKTANVDGDGNERSGIRIANFEIALK